MKEFQLFDSPLQGANLIEASAGTGKTYIITWLYLRLILEKKLSVEEILVVTFTEAATKELRDRIRGLLREALRALSCPSSCQNEQLRGYLAGMEEAEEACHRLTFAMRSLDEAAIYTIHGFCQKTLHDNAFESGALFDTELATDQENLIQEIVEDFWRRNMYDAPMEFVRFALDKKLHPRQLQKFLGNHLEHPDLKIVPELSPSSYSTEGFNEAFAKVRTSWASARAEVEKIFTESDLNRRPYKQASIPVFLAKMDQYTSSKSGNPSLFKEFEKFTASYLAKSMNKKKEPPEHLFYQECEELKNQADELCKAMDLHLQFLKYDLFHYAKSELERRKREQNIRSFGDLIIGLRTPLKDEGRGPALARSIRAKYQAALIDEFQDTDPAQWDIFQTLFDAEDHILFLIGDPKQAIYSFRGADVHAYMRAAEKISSRYTLGVNYRSESALVEGVNTIFHSVDNPFVFEGIQYRQVRAGEGNDEGSLNIHGKSEPPLHLWFVGRDQGSDSSKPIPKGKIEERITQAVAAEIAKLLRLGKESLALLGKDSLKPADIAILTRTNREANQVQSALRSLRIPSVLESTGNLFDSREAAEMRRLLAGILEPNNLGLLKAALVIDIYGLNGEELEQLVEDEEKWDQVLLNFRHYHQLWSRYDFMRMFRHFMAGEGVRSELLAFPDGERRITNLLHIAEVLHQKSLDNHLGMQETIAWLTGQLDQDSPLREKEHEIRLESDEDAVRIVTIHKSKGLEYPVVFCPFLWSSSLLAGKNKSGEFTFHDEEGHLTLAMGPQEMEENREAAQLEMLSENLRLCYVALTRAKNRCYLLWGPFNKGETSSLAYLFHNQDQPEEFLEKGGTPFKEMSDEAMLADTAGLVESAKGSIHLSAMPEESDTAPMLPKDEATELKCREFTGSVREAWRIASFSSMVYEKPDLADLPDRDTFAGSEKEDGKQIVMKAEKEAKKEEGRVDIFSFPRGTKPGNLFHEIFEILDFAATDPSPWVRQKLEEYGYDPSLWLEPVCAMVKKVLSAPLETGKDDFTLSRIPATDRVHEMEFYFPLLSVTPKKLGNIFSKHGRGELQGDLPERMERLNFSPTQGFMKGFMDLVFQYNGRYYLLDWKSNYLGGRVEDYSPENLKALMVKEYYTLQYHIYLVALNQYLSMRMPNYRYQDHFGGVFYLFLRGMGNGKAPGFGIYRDLPPVGLVEELARVLVGEGDA